MNNVDEKKKKKRKEKLIRNLLEREFFQLKNLFPSTIVSVTSLAQY